MPSRSVPQLSLSFARPKKKRAGLEEDEYQALVSRLRSDASRISEHFGLPSFVLDADRPNARSRYGLCYSDGRIRIRLVHVRTGQALRYSALIDTLVHELAHLRYMNHGPRWEALYDRMLAWCRKEGIYEPRPVSPCRRQDAEAEYADQQLSLFRIGAFW